MKGTVYYLRLTKEQRDTINLADWNSEVGTLYADVTMGFNKEEQKVAIKAAWQAGMYRAAAKVEFAGNPETVWVAMQNIEDSWVEKHDASLITEVYDERRSMSVGDFIMTEEGKVLVVASMGFEEISLEDLEGK